MAPPSDRGSVNPPRPFPCPSRRGWEPVWTHADTNASVWLTLRGGLPLPWQALDTPRSPLLPPPLASVNLPSATGRRLLLSSFPSFICGGGSGARPLFFQSTVWKLVTSRGDKGGVSVWGGPVSGP